MTLKLLRYLPASALISAPADLNGKLLRPICLRVACLWFVEVEDEAGRQPERRSRNDLTPSVRAGAEGKWFDGIVFE